ncbi:hypothetical protein [Ralstonia mannitolilytica]|uniref:hypothetical protein n=1 Tax=Ralstonia mannitolilytica TaxID=105219 RepID=UPI00292EB697|nr:hypothetical protein [Ralstonia mannitolilytica]
MTGFVGFFARKGQIYGQIAAKVHQTWFKRQAHALAYSLHCKPQQQNAFWGESWLSGTAVASGDIARVDLR